VSKLGWAARALQTALDISLHALNTNSQERQKGERLDDKRSGVYQLCAGVYQFEAVVGELNLHDVPPVYAPRSLRV
jgi:hypothetical protein